MKYNNKLDTIKILLKADLKETNIQQMIEDCNLNISGTTADKYFDSALDLLGVPIEEENGIVRDSWFDMFDKFISKYSPQTNLAIEKFVSWVQKDLKEGDWIKREIGQKLEKGNNGK